MSCVSPAAFRAYRPRRSLCQVPLDACLARGGPGCGKLNDINHRCVAATKICRQRRRRLYCSTWNMTIAAPTPFETRSSCQPEQPSCCAQRADRPPSRSPSTQAVDILRITRSLRATCGVCPAWTDGHANSADRNPVRCLCRDQLGICTRACGDRKQHPRPATIMILVNTKRAGS